MRSRIREALVVRLSAMVRSTAPIHRSDSTVPCSHEALPSDVDLHPGAPVPESWLPTKTHSSMAFRSVSTVSNHVS